MASFPPFSTSRYHFSISYKNSEDFVNKIRYNDVHNKIMVSFDVESLFTNVPLEVVLKFVERYFTENNVNLPVPSKTFIELIQLAVDKCYFTCNNLFYSQKFGLPMGSCLSPVLSNIFMEYFEQYLLPSVVDFNITWYRYVDDVFAFVPKHVDLDDFLGRLNSLVPTIKFKIEKKITVVFLFWMYV